MKIGKKIFLILVLMIAVSMVTTLLVSNAVGQVDPNDYEPNAVQADPVTMAIAGGVIGIIRVVGIVISVAWLIIIGIKYMWGSLEEKAEYKRTLVPWLIGSLFIFGAVVVVQILYEFAQEI
ncbi:MAG: TrbC/VirB2 family protein [Oscillospiraceae bacterium]|nr:TrbC/VirB2 family protein [Oscillospiraceae bacterium]